MNPLFMVDGRAYRTGVTSIRRNAKITDGVNGGPAKSGRMIRDVIGTYYNYTLTISAFDMEKVEYDSLYEVLTAPVESHVVELPYGQGRISFEAYITEVADVVEGEEMDGASLWGELDVSFYAMEPQRIPK